MPSQPSIPSHLALTRSQSYVPLSEDHRRLEGEPSSPHMHRDSLPSLHDRLLRAHEKRELCLAQKEAAALRMDSGMSNLQDHQRQNHIYEKQYHAFQHAFIRAVQSLQAAEQDIINLNRLLSGDPIPHSSPDPSPRTSLQSSRPPSQISLSSPASSDDTHISITSY